MTTKVKYQNRKIRVPVLFSNLNGILLDRTTGILFG